MTSFQVSILINDELPSPHVRLRNRHHNGSGSAPIAVAMNLESGEAAGLPAIQSTNLVVNLQAKASLYRLRRVEGHNESPCLFFVIGP